MSIYDMTIGDLEKYLEEKNLKKFTASQIFEWIYKKRIKSFDEMTNIKKETIELLKRDFTIDDINVVDKKVGKDVIKFLFKLKDERYIFDKFSSIILINIKKMQYIIYLSPFITDTILILLKFVLGVSVIIYESP